MRRYRKYVKAVKTQMPYMLPLLLWLLAVAILAAL